MSSYPQFDPERFRHVRDSIQAYHNLEAEVSQALLILRPFGKWSWLVEVGILVIGAVGILLLSPFVPMHLSVAPNVLLLYMVALEGSNLYSRHRSSFKLHILDTIESQNGQRDFEQDYSRYTRWRILLHRSLNVLTVFIVGGTAAITWQWIPATPLWVFIVLGITLLFGVLMVLKSHITSHYTVLKILLRDNL